METQRVAFVELKQTIARNVRRLRTSQGHTQQRLAELSGIDVRSVNRLEAAAQNVTIDIVERVARALSVSPSLLFMKPTDANSVEILGEIRALCDHSRSIDERVERIRELIDERST
jgi:transcriptional regulator with XRE-family HTH domain